MAWPYLPADFDERYASGWVTVPNTLFDPAKARGLYQEYIDQLVAADELGFDGLVLNEHHQNIYGLMPAPNLIASALTQRGTRGRRVRHARRHERRPPHRGVRRRRRPGDVQLQRQSVDCPRAVLGGRRPHRAGLDGRRPVQLRRQALPAALRESVAQAAPATPPSDL